MKNESLEFMGRLCINLGHNHYALEFHEKNLVISLLNVVHKNQLDQYWYHTIIYISLANILSINSQCLKTNQTFHM